MTELLMRHATFYDLPAIVALLADDPLGSGREKVGKTLDPAYRHAFDAITSDSNQLLACAERDGRVVGCLQVSFIPGLSRTGQWRGQIEGVRVASGERGAGLGRSMLRWAIDRCRERGCGLVQLTSDKTRTDALRFYRDLGFLASHEGLKLPLD